MDVVFCKEHELVVKVETVIVVSISVEELVELCLWQVNVTTSVEVGGQWTVTVDSEQGPRPLQSSRAYTHDNCKIERHSMSGSVMSIMVKL